MTGGNKIIQVYSPLHDFHPHSVVLPALDKPRFLMHMTLVGHGRLSASRLAQIQVKKNTCSCILFRSVIVEAWILCPKTCTLCPKTGFEYLNWTESLFCLGLSVSSPYLVVFGSTLAPIAFLLPLISRAPILLRISPRCDTGSTKNRHIWNPY